MPPINSNALNHQINNQSINNYTPPNNTNIIGAWSISQSPQIILEIYCDHVNIIPKTIHDKAKPSITQIDFKKFALKLTNPYTQKQEERILEIDQRNRLKSTLQNGDSEIHKSLFIATQPACKENSNKDVSFENKKNIIGAWKLKQKQISLEIYCDRIIFTPQFIQNKLKPKNFKYIDSKTFEIEIILDEDGKFKKMLFEILPDNKLKMITNASPDVIFDTVYISKINQCKNKKNKMLVIGIITLVVILTILLIWLIL